MPLTPDALRAWMSGAPQNAKPSKKSIGGDDAPPDEDGEDLPEEGTSERNPHWAGEAMADPTPEEAAELLSWLEDNEPEIHDAVLELAKAVITGDPRMVEHATTELGAATQYLNPEYPPMDDGQKGKAASLIEKHLGDKGSPEPGTPEHAQAVATGLSQARKPDVAEEEGDEDADASAGPPKTPPKPAVKPPSPKAPPFGGPPKGAPKPFGKG